MPRSQSTLLWLAGGCASCALVIALASAGKVDEALAQPAPGCNSVGVPFCNALVAPPAGWAGHVFHLSQDYPTSAPADAQPWLSFDPKAQPDAYLRAVLQYFYEGNIRADVEESFDPAQNTTRGWYNAPWQDFGTNGREPIHGLTRERFSKPGELAREQTQGWNNYAVGFYNAPGGVVIGQVWADHGKPNPALGSLPEGTVAAKLLFTTAPVSQAPYLAGSPTWNAYVYASPNDPTPKAGGPRAVLQLRLLQIDIAVKDSRAASTTGWVFGTFVYGSGPGGAPGSGWTNVAPVGLMWGNDPDYPGSGPLREEWINPAVRMPHLGYQGRLNGPIDNKISACLSCHSAAESPAGVMVPPAAADPTPWFRNIPSGTPFDSGRTALDYSLQLSVGIANFQAAQTQARTPFLLRKFRALVSPHDDRPPRDGGPTS